MPAGQVILFKAGKGFGFISPDEERPDVFLCMSAVSRGAAHKHEAERQQENRDRGG